MTLWYACWEIERNSERQRETDKDRERLRETERDWERPRESERVRASQKETERDWERDRKRQREGSRQLWIGQTDSQEVLSHLPFFSMTRCAGKHWSCPREHFLTWQSFKTSVDHALWHHSEGHPEWQSQRDEERSSRPVWAEWTDGHTFAFLELLSELKINCRK